LFLAFTVLLVATHLPYLKLPFFWDELGQFVPASLDLYHDGSWVPHSTTPNVHPPALMAVLATVWHIFGYSILATRLTMLTIAGAGVTFAFLLAIRLSRGTAGAPAFAAVLFLIASPIFYTQAMMAQLDMPAMTMTILALLLFLDRSYVVCAAACTVLVLFKETAITTPLVFALWLIFREKRVREAFYFTAPALALAGWLLVLKQSTGHWLGNAEFTEYNVGNSLRPLHLIFATGMRLYYLFISNGHFIGAIALFAGWSVLRGPAASDVSAERAASLHRAAILHRDWEIAALVGIAQVAMVTLFGGAILDRYLVPVLPILYAAMAAAATVYPMSWQWISQTAMVVLLIAGWFWNPPYPYPYEDNLTMVQFVKVQKEAADYLEAYAPHLRVASAWPFTEELRQPAFGYVERPIQEIQAKGLHLDQLADLDRSQVDLLVVFSNVWNIGGHLIDLPQIRDFLRTHFDYHPQATPEEIESGLGYVRMFHRQRGEQWVDIYVRPRERSAVVGSR